MSPIENYPHLPIKFRRKETLIPHQEMYPNDRLRQQIRQFITDSTGVGEGVIPPISDPPKGINGDFGLPLFPLAKVLRENPRNIAINLAGQFSEGRIANVQTAKAEDAYINFDLDYDAYARDVLTQTANRKDMYGAENIGHGTRIVIDMSSPNIAKPMSVGHLRSTVIGHSLARILEYTGHEVIKDNHLGDWGAQFGMLLRAYELWGNEIPQLSQPGKEVEGLLKLYVKIHEEVDIEKGQKLQSLREILDSGKDDTLPGFDEAYQKAFANSGSHEQAVEEALSTFVAESSLEREGREWFRRLEQGDPEARSQWEWITNLSMKEFQTVYDLLGVDFDFALGESFYSPMLANVVDEVKKQTFVTEEKGAVVAHLEDSKLGKMVIQTGDGRSLYVTRDLATAIFRNDVLRAQRILYVVGADQKHYFQQWFEILNRMGYEVAQNCEHIYFGMISLPEGKMSTRKGRVVFLKDVIDQGIEKAEKAISEKNPKLFSDEEKKKETARQIAVGAVVWSDLSSDMRRNIVFEWENMLSFDGFSAPYVQYAHARAKSILRKAEASGITAQHDSDIKLTTDSEKELVKKIGEFPDVVKSASKNLSTVSVAEYVHSLSQLFNQFYREDSVLAADTFQTQQTRLRIVEATTQTIKNALYLLGIEAPEEM